MSPCWRIRPDASLLKREPYAVDIPAMLDAAAETGTWIEINAAPKRLDLDWRWWPLAKEKGVQLRDQSGRASAPSACRSCGSASAWRAKAG